MTIELAPGDDHLIPSPDQDSTCGNCEDPNQSVRDTASEATRAAVVVRRAHVTIENCTIGPNLGDSTIVARRLSVRIPSGAAVLEHPPLRTRALGRRPLVDDHSSKVPKTPRPLAVAGGGTAP